MRKSTLAFVCAVLFSACAWGEGDGTPAPTPDSGTAQAVCGDGTCAPSEVGNCAGDCGGTTNPVCGDGNCQAPESNATCASDCPATGPICGDATCDMAGGENSTNCPGDCTTSGVDCMDPILLLGCALCLDDPGVCSILMVTQADCEACVGGGFSFCEGGAPNGTCNPAAGEDNMTCPEDCP
jgi:hypothetical protein